ncbi:pentapeptide repeat protein [Nostoc commune NIES-4072]|uniref:Pentapeptide repeat protein n=1 Tax=Nostoc commune NIES-4072 TaxID=2005467 RepID=A0A2R5FFT2_NOSCO|nr:pentapeptide repeat-containing protein [Nostoc commune]BBD65276.1 pentapeptide repeat protein [Nostoc commune HK-02]GBG17400.1 pentapeptide repeat protein [Nostoc commune NIES-4072]
MSNQQPKYNTTEDDLTKDQKFDIEKQNYRLEVIKTWISGLGLLATVFAGIGLYFNYNSEKQKLVSERFSKAVEAMAAENNDRNLVGSVGGIYTLEWIANNSQNDYWTVMEVLTLYVREKAKIPTQNTLNLQKQEKKDQPGVQQNIKADVQAVLTVIKRRNITQEDPKDKSKFIDLSASNLTRAKLQGANLNGAHFTESILTGAFLQNLQAENGKFQLAFLKSANLDGANLKNACLNSAKLMNAQLEGANLEGANLVGSDLKNSRLTNANLKNARLTNADLENANLKGANLDGADLTNVRNPPEEVKLAQKKAEDIYRTNTSCL